MVQKTDSNEVNDLFGANITRAQFNKIFAPFFNVPSNSAGFFIVTTMATINF